MRFKDSDVCSDLSGKDRYHFKCIVGSVGKRDVLLEKLKTFLLKYLDTIHVHPDFIGWLVNAVYKTADAIVKHHFRDGHIYTNKTMFHMRKYLWYFIESAQFITKQ